ncbi:MAG TPA: peptidoglycan DD-metalloendopeptidase family protein [candidate division Zixibacteria bacterium]|nr:peptidoglycan DD-metalloendopeptidase family protein [candidate division Zixibacteria bacterium]
MEPREHVTYRTRPGENLINVLNRFQLSKGEKLTWTRSIKRDLSTRPLPPGREIHFFFGRRKAPSQRSGNLSLKALELDYDDAWTFTWEKDPKGILFQKREKPYDVEVHTASAVIDSTLYDSGQRAGIQPALLSQLADIFAWDVNLERDIGYGDSFKIVYEKRSRRGQETAPSLRILAAELINAGRKLTAIYFERQKGIGGYFNEEGRSLARAFLRFPLEFTSITSHFTGSRFHPVLRINAPHTGVDFAARRGTPVRAVGDGVVTAAKRNGAYGKLVEIRHESAYTTRYAHLDRFAYGIRDGVTVRKGDIIGYVGSTGRSTGPHLHFELYKDGQYVDPLSVDFPADDAIEPALQRRFEQHKQLLLVQLPSDTPS